jgi:hypothetical protein
MRMVCAGVMFAVFISFGAVVLAQELQLKGPHCKGTGVAVKVDSDRSKAEEAVLTIAATTAISPYPRQAPNWTCICQIGQPIYHKEEGGWTEGVWVTVKDGSVTATVNDFQGSAEVDSAATTVISPQALTSGNPLPALYDAVRSAVDQAMRNANPCHQGWKGTITYKQELSGDEYSNELQTYSNTQQVNVTITVNGSVATASSHSEEKHVALNRRRALRGGAITIEDDGGSTSQALAEGSSAAQVEVNYDEQTGNYDISPGFTPVVGTRNDEICLAGGGKCTTSSQPYSTGMPRDPRISGVTKDPNHLSGSQQSETKNVGSHHSGTIRYTVNWDLTRVMGK